MHDPPMEPYQAMMDGMSAAWQRKRAATQMTLGKLIGALEGLGGDRLLTGFGDPHSYRGYYDDLSFAPTLVRRTAGDLLNVVRSDCMGRTFTGYKGGEFMMGENTPVWIAEWGATGERLMGLDTESKVVRPITQPEEW